MIRLDRGPEPEPLARIRAEELARVGSIAAGGSPTSKEIGQRYAVVKDDLWKRQFYKCYFCESKIVDKYNDVEHYRPKAEADRSPGHPDTSGYWWLAWTWNNLMFSCALCNRSHKSTLFPLQLGSVPLALHETPPGQEMPLLIDPFDEDPIDHIQFRPLLVDGRERWMPLPRAGSEKGKWTIKVAGLDNPSLIDLYGDHVKDQVMPKIKDIQAALGGEDPHKVRESWDREARRLLINRLPFASLTYDVIDHFIPEPVRSRYDLELKKPSL
jgi:5-methylcytosine-specific restriction endonuclease McrA